jgi:fructose-specific phosphotransferase system IIC component
MRQMIAFVMLGTVIVALAVLLGTAEQPREDELARSIARLVETAR